MTQQSKITGYSDYCWLLLNSYGLISDHCGMTQQSMFNNIPYIFLWQVSHIFRSWTSDLSRKNSPFFGMAPFPRSRWNTCKGQHGIWMYFIHINVYMYMYMYNILYIYIYTYYIIYYIVYICNMIYIYIYIVYMLYTIYNIYNIIWYNIIYNIKYNII